MCRWSVVPGLSALPRPGLATHGIRPVAPMQLMGDDRYKRWKAHHSQLGRLEHAGANVSTVIKHTNAKPNAP